jgi:hypothetical protein
MERRQRPADPGSGRGLVAVDRLVPPRDVLVQRAPNGLA